MYAYVHTTMGHIKIALSAMFPVILPAKYQIYLRKYLVILNIFEGASYWSFTENTLLTKHPFRVHYSLKIE